MRARTPFAESGNRDNCHRIFVTIQGRTRVVKDNTRVLNFTTRRAGDRLSGYLLKEMVEDGRYIRWPIIFKKSDPAKARVFRESINRPNRSHFYLSISNQLGVII